LTATLHREQLHHNESTRTEDWLRGCAGFRVYGPDGWIGYVDGLEERDGGVDLVIAAGLFRPLTLVAHDGEVHDVDEVNRRVVVSAVERRHATA
jgi:hypothetical protein